ncbi:MAG: hypothetical protein O2821_00250 [Chloroflexi bacterium]|nr:hypothetical protein [Chloroflexota bacterium]MDA1226737.1 hypothetical protein [Chloroflexota bacterium]
MRQVSDQMRGMRIDAAGSRHRPVMLRFTSTRLWMVVVVVILVGAIFMLFTTPGLAGSP